MKKLTTLYIKKFSKLNEEVEESSANTPKKIPGEWVLADHSPYKNLSELDTVEGPDGIIYSIRDMKWQFNKCKSMISQVYPATSYFLSILDTTITFDVETMATDGLRLFINPAFFKELAMKAGAPAVIFVILHEVFHNLYRHIQRGEKLGHNPTKSNIAGDYEINLALEELTDDDGNKEFEGITNKIGGLIDQIYDKMAYETIYDKLPPSNMETSTIEDGFDNNDEIKLDPRYKDGYRVGWNKAIEELRKLGILEGFKTSYKNILNELNLGGSNPNMDPYKAGFADGYSKAMDKVQSLKNGAKVTIGGDSNGKNGPKVEQIDGLEPIRPKFPVEVEQGKENQDINTGGSDNEPLEINAQKQSQIKQDQQNQQNQQNQNSQGSQNNSSSGSDQGKPDKDQFGEVDYEKRRGSNSSNGDQSNDLGNTSGEPNSGQNNQNGQNNQQNQNSSNPYGSFYDTDKKNAENDPTKGMNKVTKISSGFGTNGNLYKDGELVAEGNGKQSNRGDLIPKEIGDKIVQSDGSWSKYHKHIGTDPDRVWEDAIKEKGDALIKELKGHGCRTADALEELLNSWEPPTQDWKKILKKYLKGLYEEVIDKMPKKKKVDREIYRKYQKKRGESGKDIIYLIDVSGSMSNERLRQCLREINGLAEDIKVKRAWLMQCDTELKWDSIDRLRPEKKRDTRHALEMFTRRGCGGTDFEEPFNWISTEFVKKHGIPNCVIVLTDGDVGVPTKPKLWYKNIIWFIVKGGNDQFNPGYGKKIYWKNPDDTK